MVRTRFAPSPTGFIHLGNVWVAFLNWLWTRQHDGQIILRIEDIDRQRCQSQYTDALLSDLDWLGLDWDEGPETCHWYGSVIQSQRLDFYQNQLTRWRENQTIYPCYCSRAALRRIASAPHLGEVIPVYDGHCRYLTPEERAAKTKTPSWRFKMETQTVCFRDLLCGDQKKTLHAGNDDFVLARADGMIAYQLASAADDGIMKVTHVFRGRDLLPSTAGQVCLIQKLGYKVPEYAHVPLLTDSEGIRLSKRQHGITIRDMRDAGIAAEDIIGTLLFWAGAIAKPEKVSANQALQNFDFFSCTNFTKAQIMVSNHFLVRQ